MDQQLAGVGVSPGRACAPARMMAPALEPPVEGQALSADADPAHEAGRISAASEAVREDLRKRSEQAEGEAREILSATAEMAADPALVTTAATAVAEHRVGPERAVYEAASTVMAMLADLGGYMAERVRDVADVRDRIVAELRGLPAPGIPGSDEPFILVAHDLAPADTATLSPDRVVGLVTVEGGPQSHTAILARSLGIPAVVAVSGADRIGDGADIYVDGAAGRIRLDPGEEERRLVQAWSDRSRTLGHFDGNGRFADGSPIALLANVADADDAAAAAGAHAQGIGLLRTEFCFLGRSTEPGIDEQAEQYRRVFEAFPGAKVVIRTLDAGADKPLPFLTDTSEPNPALGVRGFRTTRRAAEVLTNQLTAIARAAANAEADVQVMAPMIATPDEAADFARQCRQVGLSTAGVMVETPAAALSSAAIFSHVDFVSIGTNDLTQYTMAADRQLGALADLNDAWQPALLRMVAMTVSGAEARQAGPGPVGVCGEVASDPTLAVVLAGLGVTSLSMSARALGPVSAVLRTVSRDTARSVAETALKASSADAARAAARAEIPALDEYGL